MPQRDGGVGPAGASNRLILDFFILWGWATAIVKYAWRGNMTPETAGLLIAGGAIVLALIRLFGSQAFRSRTRIPKALGSVGSFAFSVADGDHQAALNVAIMTAAFPIAGIGIMIVVRAALRDDPMR